MPKQDTLTYWGLLGLGFFEGDGGLCLLIVFPSHSANFASLLWTDTVFTLFPII